MDDSMMHFELFCEVLMRELLYCDTFYSPLLNMIRRPPPAKSTKQWSDEMFENDFKVPNKVAARLDVHSAVAFCKKALNFWVGDEKSFDADLFLGIFSAMKMGTQEDAPPMFPDDLYDPTCPPLKPVGNAQKMTNFGNYTLPVKFSLKNLAAWYKKIWNFLGSPDLKLKQLAINYVGFLLLIAMRSVYQKPQVVGKYFVSSATSEFGKFWPNTNIKHKTSAPSSSFIEQISDCQLQTEKFTRIMSHIVAAYTVSPAGVVGKVLQSACLDTFHGTGMGSLRFLLAASTTQQVEPQTIRSCLKEVTMNEDYLCDEALDEIFNNLMPAGQLTWPWARAFSDEVFKELRTEGNEAYVCTMIVVAANGDGDKVSSVPDLDQLEMENAMTNGFKILMKLNE